MAPGENNEPDYSSLLKATITYDYLHTNSTTHEFVFGAVAELVDNSRDAGAKNLRIDYDAAVGLSFLDDGVGMMPEEAEKIVAFGHSLKRCETGKVGRYGNGLKSGALRLGKDFMVFTKRGDFSTALMLSRTFHQNMGIKDVIVPAPQWMDKFKPIASDPRKHEMEMDLIYKYSPFKTKEAIFEQFNKIGEQSGTLVVLYNLRRIETGQYEMDFETDWSDIGLTDVPPEREPERNSLRAYLAILYLNPYTKIYLRGKKVHTIRILSTLGDAFTYTKECSFKGAKEKMIKELQQEKKAAEEEVARAKSDYGGAIDSVRGNAAPVNILSKTKMHNFAMISAAERLKTIQAREAELLKNKNKPYPAEFSCGLNIHHRNRYGCMIYNNGRLIEMYVKLPIQKENNDIYMRCLGVVGVVDLPYEVLEPTHNKQSFESKRDYQVVMRAFNDCMEQYWDDRLEKIGRGPQDIKRFWQQFGYNDSAWSAEASETMETKHKRFQKTNHVVQCDLCLKWRTIDYQPTYVLKGVPDNWRCADHPDSSKRECIQPEHFGRLNPAKRKLKPKLKKAPSHAATSLIGQKPPPLLIPSFTPRPAPSSKPPVPLKPPVSLRPRELVTLSARPSRQVKYRELSSDEEEVSDEEDPKTEPKGLPKSRSSSVASPTKSPAKPTPANRPVRAIRKRTMEASYAMSNDSDEEEVPVKKLQARTSSARRSKMQNSDSEGTGDLDVGSASSVRISRNGPYPNGPIPPRMAEAAEKKRKAEEEAKKKKDGATIAKRVASEAKPLEKSVTAPVMSDKDEQNTPRSSSVRLSSIGTKKATEAPKKVEKEKFRNPPRRVLSGSEQEEEQEDSEEPIKKARTKADLRKQLDQSDSLSPPSSIPDQDMAPTVKSSMSSEDIKTSPRSMKINGIVHNDAQKELEELRKKFAEMEVKLNEAVKQNELLEREASVMRQQALTFNGELDKIQATANSWRRNLHEFLSHLDPFVDGILQDIITSCEGDPFDNFNWEDLAESVYMKLQNANVLQNEVYQDERSLINDIEAVLLWVRGSGGFQFSENPSSANRFRLFRELCSRITSDPPQDS